MEPRAPSGLCPSPPPRPAYREPHPVRVGAVLVGAGLTAAWLLVVGLFATSAALSPLAPVGIWMGVWLMRRIPEDIFYRTCYAILVVVGAKLLWDGIAGL